MAARYIARDPARGPATLARMVELRMIGPDDWPDWRDIRLRALADSPAAFGSNLARERAFSESDWRGRTDGSVLVYDDGAPVAMGAGWADDREGYLMVVAMWTEPSRRGEGLGGMVLDAVVALAQSRGLQAHLFLMHENPEAGRLYERHGFVRSGLVEEHGGRLAEQLVHAQDQAEP
jgi:predicted GNAT family acetyltransferase